MELRIYTIQPRKRQEFVSGWKRGVYPLRLARGFRIDGAWALEEENQFVWVFSYDGPLSWEKANAAYHTSP